MIKNNHSRISLSVLVAANFALLTDTNALASTQLESCGSSDVNQRIKALSGAPVSAAAKWPREGMNNESLQSLPLEERLNQLVLDDNLRTLHMSVHSDFARHTPSFKRIESLVEQLANRNLPAQTRWEAARALGETKPHIVATYGLPSLIQALHGDPDITVRNYAALSLVKIDLRSAVPQLIHGLDSSDADIRQISASALHTAGAAAVPYLVKLVRCDDPHLKKLGCIGLAEVGAPAGNAVSVLRGAETENDAGSTFSAHAAASIEKIRAENSALTAAFNEVPFDASKWKSEEHLSARPAMAKHILSSGLLNGRSFKQVTEMMGRGISMNKGKELRYNIGLVPASFIASISGEHKKHSTASRDKAAQPADAWLVVSLASGLVTGCELKSFADAQWNVASEDHLVARGI